MKLDNVLLSRPGCLKEIKLADFGLSDFYRPGATMRTNCGSISYLAPEVSKRGSMVKKKSRRLSGLCGKSNVIYMYIYIYQMRGFVTGVHFEVLHGQFS